MSIVVEQKVYSIGLQEGEVISGNLVQEMLPQGINLGTKVIVPALEHNVPHADKRNHQTFQPTAEFNIETIQNKQCVVVDCEGISEVNRENIDTLLTGIDPQTQMVIFKFTPSTRRDHYGVLTSAAVKALEAKGITGVGTNMRGIGDQSTHYACYDGGITITEALRLQDVPSGNYTFTAEAVQEGWDGVAIKAWLNPLHEVLNKALS